MISREGLRNLTVEGQSASLALLGMMLGIGAAAGCDGCCFWLGKPMENAGVGICPILGILDITL